MYHLGKTMVLASVILSLSIQITESLYPKQFLVEENRRGINGMLESGSWKLIRSKGVSYTQCLSECLKNEYCYGFAYKPPNQNEAYTENCNILGSVNNDDLSPVGDASAAGWTLYKCDCCQSEDCDTFPDLVKV